MPILDFFLLKADGRMHCLHCVLKSTSYSWKKGNGTGTLMQHVQASHRSAFLKHETAAAGAAAPSDDHSSVSSPPVLKRKQHESSAAASTTSASSISSAKKQRLGVGPLAQAFQTVCDDDVRRKAAIAFAINRIPFRVISDPDFVAFLDAARSSTAKHVNRKALKGATINVEHDMREQIIKRLASSPDPVAIAFDGWTNVVHSKVTNIVLICGGIAYYWCSITNKTEKNTAEWMQRNMEPHIDHLLQLKVRIVGFIADNESVNTALFNRMAEKYPFLVRIPCAAHTVQLVVKNSMECPRWKNVRDGVEALLKELRLKDARQKLHSLQIADHGSALNLILPNDTRWNSFLFASQRILKLRDYIHVISKHPEAWWNELAELVDFLVPFQIATDVLQKDSATLYDIFSQWNSLSKHISEKSSGEERSFCDRATIACR